MSAQLEERRWSRPAKGSTELEKELDRSLEARQYRLNQTTARPEVSERWRLETTNGVRDAGRVWGKMRRKERCVSRERQLRPVKNPVAM